MAKNSNGIVETVRELAEPIADSLGCWVWDVEFVKEGTRKILRITIDSEEGIDINVCEQMHRAIDVVLDEVDPIAEAYYLEISSPGIERELRTEEHITLSIGARVLAKLFAAKDGVKSYEGTLKSYSDGKMTITVGENDVVLDKTDVSKLTTVYFEN